MTKKLNIESDTKIYVACPANCATGGPELLHQFVYELNKLGFNAYMLYYDRINNKSPIHDAYKLYNNNFVDNIIDDSKNILVIPEVKTALLYEYSNIQKIIWWLSVDNFYSFLQSSNKLKAWRRKLLHKINLYPHHKIYRFNKNEQILHFVQSEYAKQMLVNKGIKTSFYLGDYLNELFIKKQIKNISQKKENIVIYNPKKGVEFTKRIINLAKDIQFIPIQDMTKEEVSNLLSTAKVYIDFGNHPGKDRIPREAAISGCCVITGKDGSAKYYEDVPILDEFKYDAKIQNIPIILEKIKNCFANYDEESRKFLNYREIITSEQNKFISDLKYIFS